MILSKETWRRVEAAAKFGSRGPDRGSILGVGLRFEGTTLDIVATDGHRGHHERIELPEAGLSGWARIFPVQIKAIRAYGTPGDVVIERVSPVPYDVSVEVPGVVRAYSGPALPGSTNFEGFEGILPYGPIQVGFDPAFSATRTRGAWSKVDPVMAKSAAMNADVSVVQVMLLVGEPYALSNEERKLADEEYPGAPRVHLNPEYWSGALASFPGGRNAKILVETTDSTLGPVRLTGQSDVGTITHLIMPMR